MMWVLAIWLITQPINDVQQIIDTPFETQAQCEQYWEENVKPQGDYLVENKATIQGDEVLYQVTGHDHLCSMEAIDEPDVETNEQLEEGDFQ